MSNSPPEQELTALTISNTGINRIDVADDTQQHEEGDKLSKCSNIMFKMQSIKLSTCLRCFYFPILRVNILHTFCCQLYHLYNFSFSIFIFVFDVTTITTSICLTVFACIGIVLLLFSFEFILLFSRIDLWTNYYLAENKKNDATKSLIKLSVYTRNLAVCGCDGFCGIMWQRTKHLFTSCNMFTIILYHIIIRPIITALTCLTAFSVFYFLCYFVPLAILPDMGRYPWITAIGYMLISFVTLPIALRISNYCAYISKCSAYYCYTYYYSNGDARAGNDDQKSLLNQHKNSTKTVSHLADNM